MELVGIAYNSVNAANILQKMRIEGWVSADDIMQEDNCSKIKEHSAHKKLPYAALSDHSHPVHTSTPLSIES